MKFTRNTAFINSSLYKTEKHSRKLSGMSHEASKRLSITQSDCPNMSILNKAIPCKEDSDSWDLFYIVLDVAERLFKYKQPHN